MPETEKPIDFRSLLCRYIRHVQAAEGNSFCDTFYFEETDTELTDAESRFLCAEGQAAFEEHQARLRRRS